MTVYEIPNIEHCDVRALGTVGFRIIAHEGWYIHLNDGDEETANNWTREVGLPASADFSIVEIRAEADLPDGAEINGYDNNEQEVM
jgi:hypothetical protein